jgi:hypothetical protein
MHTWLTHDEDCDHRVPRSECASCSPPAYEDASGAWTLALAIGMLLAGLLMQVPRAWDQMMEPYARPAAVEAPANVEVQP